MKHFSIAGRRNWRLVIMLPDRLRMITTKTVITIAAPMGAVKSVAARKVCLRC
jgi:hypothetical protein